MNIQSSTIRGAVAILFSLSIVVGFLFLGKVDETIFTTCATLVLGYFFGKSTGKEGDAVAQSVSSASSFGTSIASIKLPKITTGHIRGVTALAFVGGIVWGFVSGTLPVNVYAAFASTVIGYYFARDKDSSDHPDIVFKDDSPKVLDQKELDTIGDHSNKSELLNG